jgi:hypothetical protein
MSTDLTKNPTARLPRTASSRACRNSRAAALAFALAVAVAHGQTWNGGAAPNGNWSEGANWGGSAPVSAATTDLTFAGGAQLAATNNIANPFLLHDLTFDGTAGAFVLAGSPLELHGGVTNYSANPQTIGTHVTLATNSVWNAASGNIILTANMMGSTNNLTKDGGHVLRLQGATRIGDLDIAAGTLLLSGGAFTNTWASSADLFTGAGGALVVTNGAKFVVGDTLVTLLADYGQDDCEITVAGPGSTWVHGKGIINMSSSECTLRVGNGGVVRNADRLNVGFNSPRGLNRVVLFDGGQISNVNSTVAAYIGSGSTSVSNSVTVAGTNAAGVRATWDLKDYLLSVGASGSDYNTLTVGQGGQLLRAKVTIGSSDGGNFNALIVTNGGRVVTSGITNIGGTGGASSNRAWIGGADPITGEPTYYSVGGALQVGFGSRANDNRLIVADGAAVTNIINPGFTVGGSGAASNNAAVVSGGARVYCTAVTVGGATAAFGNSLQLDGGSLWSTGIPNVGNGNRSASNEVVVTGNGYWSLAAQSLVVGNYSDATGNRVLVSDGGVVTNSGNSANLWVGSGARAHGNRLVVSASGRLDHKPDSVGVGCNTVATPVAGGNWNLLELGAGTISSRAHSRIGYGSHTNAVHLYGGATWQAGDGSGDNLFVGQSGGTGNSLRVGRGATLNLPGSLLVGDATSTGNSVALEGGSVSAASATVYAGNEIRVRIDSLGLTPMVVSGTATLEAGTFVRPSRTGDAPFGTHAILTAGALVDSGIALDPSADPAWILSVEGNTLYLTYGGTDGVVVDDDDSLVWENLAITDPVTFAFTANGTVASSPTRMVVLVSETIAGTPVTVTGTVAATETAGIVTGTVELDAADFDAYDTLFFRGFRY